LYILRAVHKAGLVASKAPKHGPDVKLCVGGQTVWIECVAPTAGTGVDAVPQKKHQSYSGPLYAEAQLLLRYMQAVKDKKRKFAAYVKAGIVSATDVLIIAVYQGAIENSDLREVEVPILAKAVLGIGELVRPVIPYSELQPEEYFAWRPEVTKANGSTVSATGFLGQGAMGDQDAMGDIVSALLYAIKPIWHMRWEPECSLGVIHNPSAVVPLPRNILPRRCEYWVDAHTSTLEHEGVRLSRGS
jgi:hypothetical protein